MPNWCHNTLDVTGEPEAVAAYVEHVRIPAGKIDNEERALFLRLADDAEAAGHGERAKELRESVEDQPEQVDYAGQPLTFEADAPTPEESEGGDGWYFWRLENWGTKWDASFTEPFIAVGSDESDPEATVAAQGVTVVDGAAIYKFDTAWAPPAAWLRATAKAHPELTFVLRFGEPGGDFAGQIMCIGGEVTDERELEVSEVLAEEEMWF